MVKLIGFGNAFGLVDPSPFVAKVDAYLRLAKIPYEYQGNAGALRTAPKKKLPIINDNGKTIADSYFIIEYLNEKYQVELDKDLTPEQVGLSHLLTKSLDENFYWCIVYSRWMRDDTWPIIKENFFGNLPFPAKQIIPAMLRKGVKKTLHGQGLGRHSDSEIMQVFEHSLRSLDKALGTKTYFFGDKPSSFDASAYAFLSACISTKLDNPFNRQAKTYNKLVEYCHRFEAEYYNQSSDIKQTA